MQSLKPPSEAPPSAGEFHASARYLHLPVKIGGPMRMVTVSVDGKEVRRFKMELAEDPAQADWWAPLDLSFWKGKPFQVRAEGLPAGAKTISGLEISENLKHSENLYDETLRPQIHFSSRRGWLNDPNGLVFYDGVYHLFYQHNPYGTEHANMHWGHAVSPDLVHWKELDIALYPDRQWMWSGGGMVDWKNVSGLGKDGKPPLLFFYTAHGDGADAQCLAWSLDHGMTLNKYEGNPIIKSRKLSERDPKVGWDPGSQKWILVLYVGKKGPGLDANGNPKSRHTVEFYNSTNLIDWTYLSEIDGYYECPDFFQLAIDGDPEQTKWVLLAANSNYQVGTFDGKTFHPETAMLHGPTGSCFYGPQTFSDIPSEDGRRIQIGWLRGSVSPGMPFSQCVSLPVSLALVSTPQGPRLTWTPVKELEALRKLPAHRIALPHLRPGAPNPFAHVATDATELVLEIEPGTAKTAELKMRGVSLNIDFEKNEICSGQIKTSLDIRRGESVKLRIFQDRTTMEIFFKDYQRYVPFPAVINPDDRSVSLSVTGGETGLVSADLFEMKSSWTPEARARR